MGAMQKWKVETWNKAGELQLLAAAPIAADEEILREQPLLTAPVERQSGSGVGWDLTATLLADAGLRNVYYGWQLRSEDMLPRRPADTEIEKALAKRHAMQRPMVRKLHAGVSSNAISYESAEGQMVGHGLYKTLARVNHSCDPSAALSTLDAASGEQALLARRRIEVGQEITRSYLPASSGFLEKNFLVRNLTLVKSFGFVCRCSRCLSELPADLKGVDLLQFFHEFIAQHREKFAN